MAPAGKVTNDAFHVVKEVAQALNTTHTVTSGVVSAAKNGSTLLSRIEGVAPSLEKLAPTLEKIAPYAEKVAPILEKVAIPIAIVAGGAKAASEFAHGHDLKGSQTLGQTGGAIGGALAGTEGG